MVDIAVKAVNIKGIVKYSIYHYLVYLALGAEVKVVSFVCICVTYCQAVHNTIRAAFNKLKILPMF